MINFRNKLINYMTGRYGVDQLSFALIIFMIALNLINSFTKSVIISVVSIIFTIICYLRVISKNIDKRYRENQIFLNYYNPTKHWLKKKILRLKERKTYKYYKCKNCSKTIRVPRGKGKIIITCPVCKNEFIKRT